MAQRPKPVRETPGGGFRHVGPLSRSMIRHDDLQFVEGRKRAPLKEGDFIVYHPRLSGEFKAAPHDQVLGVFSDGAVQSSGHKRNVPDAPFECQSGHPWLIDFSPLGAKRVAIRVGDRFVSNFNELTREELTRFKKEQVP